MVIGERGELRFSEGLVCDSRDELRLVRQQTVYMLGREQMRDDWESRLLCGWMRHEPKHRAHSDADCYAIYSVPWKSFRFMHPRPLASSGAWFRLLHTVSLRARRGPGGLRDHLADVERVISVLLELDWSFASLRRSSSQRDRSSQPGIGSG